MFLKAWRTHGELLAPYLAPDTFREKRPPANDRETGLYFRALAALTWFQRFAA